MEVRHERRSGSSAVAGAYLRRVAATGITWHRAAKTNPHHTVLASLAILVLVAMIGGFLPAVALALLLSLVGTPAVLPWQGRTLYARWGQRWYWRRHRRARRTYWWDRRRHFERSPHPASTVAPASGMDGAGCHRPRLRPG